MTVANDLGFVRGVLIECGNRLLGAAFLGDTNNRVQDENRENLREKSLAQQILQHQKGRGRKKKKGKKEHSLLQDQQMQSSPRRLQG